jgi:hypothetical protein
MTSSQNTNSSSQSDTPSNSQQASDSKKSQSPAPKPKAPMFTIEDMNTAQFSEYSKKIETFTREK